MFLKMELTDSQMEKILDVKNIAASTTGYTLSTKRYEISDVSLMLKSLLCDDVKVNITIDIRLISNLSTNKSIKFTRRPLCYTVIGFTQSYSGPLNVNERFIRLIQRSYKSTKTINITLFSPTLHFIWKTTTNQFILKEKL